MRWGKAQQVDAGAAAVGVEQQALVQGPVVVGGRLPQVHRRLADQLAQLLLPVAQGVAVAAVDFHRSEQGVAAMLGQPAMQALGKAAEVRVLPVAQAQYGVLEILQGQGAAQHLALEAPGAVRRFAVAEGADHEQRVLGIQQVLLADAGQRLDLGRYAGGLQLPGGLPGQLFGETALAGEADQPGRGIAGVGAQALARVLDLAFLAPAIQVQQPAGDKNSGMVSEAIVTRMRPTMPK